MKNNLQRILWFCAVISLITACQPIQPLPQGHAGDAAVTGLWGNLGDHTMPITVNDPLAQKFFDEGLALTYGFNHEEAIHQYERGLAVDPNCAMCYWGIAYALGPNINAPMNALAVKPAWDALQKALDLAPTVSAREQAYINALAQRYSADESAERPPLDEAYADSMREVVAAYPDDLDAATLFAEALMTRTPWNYWANDEPTTDFIHEIQEALERVLASDPNNPGANHFYIHLIEATSTPERAEPAADRLGALVPGATHLVHMPAHLFWRVGRYHDSFTANDEAVHTDDIVYPDLPTGHWYPALYYPHNVHFMAAASAMEGNSALAITAAHKLIERIPAENYKLYPMLEDFMTIPYQVLVRYGKWEEMLAERAPGAEYGYATNIWQWAQGMALANTGEVDEARAILAQVQEQAATPEMEAFFLQSGEFGNHILTVAGHQLAAEIARAEQQSDEVIAQLEQAVAVQDAFYYTEPPPWFFPVRQYLGAALLEQGKAAEAEAVYRKDLAQLPKNGWALFGLMQSLDAQGKSGEVGDVQKEFDAAWQNADVTLTASRVQ